MSKSLPIAIVIPHAGLAIPPELAEHVALTEEQIFNEADAYTDLLYDFRRRVAQWHSFPYARAILDVNRPKDAHAMIRAGDGFVKQRTSYGANVFKDGFVPDDALVQTLIANYWQAWHDTMASLAEDDSIKLVIDAHSMAGHAPQGYDATQAVRPRVALCNLGDEDGNPRDETGHLSAPPELVREAGAIFGEVLSGIDDVSATSAPYAVNKPYYGGPILWLHGGKAQPWLMIELSRATYIGAQTGDSPVVPADMARIAQIREQLWQGIERVVDLLSY
ncbi:MAG: N-formylglutamate amidohydrolase [Chloroflexota bacterium]